MNSLPVVSSSSNHLIKQARSLRQRKARAATGLFLVEGIHPVGEAIEAGWQIEALLYAPDLLSSGFAQHLLAKQSQHGVRCQAVASDLFATLTEKDNPQGLLAVVRQKDFHLQELSPNSFQRGVALVSPQDPGNVGTILRTMDAVGADGLLLLDPAQGTGGGVDPYHPTCVRASMGALFWKPVVQASFGQFTTWARQNGHRLIGSSAHANTDYRAIPRQASPWILLLGSEQKGLSEEQKAACDLVVAMPMCGRVSSLNLAVAAGVLLYAMVQPENR
ncbi:MAG: RNA methyltransferase [Anaerolineales bacterium]